MSTKTGALTYGRKYQAVGVSDVWREQFSCCREIMQRLESVGWQYRCSGGYFETKVEGREPQTPISYALGHFREQIERLEDVKIERLQDLCDALGGAAPDYLAYNYFTEVEAPLQGDLVVYNGQKSLHQKLGGHVGIYQISPRESVLSKWTFVSKKVFQHDFFAGPSTFGNKARFYRIREAIKPLVLPPQLDLASPLYTIDETGAFTYIGKAKHISVRKLLNREPFDAVKAIHTSVICLKHLNKFEGKCAEYALRVALASISSSPLPRAPAAAFDFIQDHFIPTNAPCNGDLVVYLDEEIGAVFHFGIYRAPNCIESKWGNDGVYQGPPFDVPFMYGNKIKCYKLNPESFATESKT
jgi:hypothetical protein